MLPPLTSNAMDIAFNAQTPTLLVAAEGFEPRSLAWISTLPKKKLFIRSLIYKNVPERKNKLNELLDEVSIRSANTPAVQEFHRHCIEETELLATSALTSLTDEIKRIVIDISVMSRILIIMLAYALRKFEGEVIIVYSEPADYQPDEQTFRKSLAEQRVASVAPTSGVRYVARTPMLSSTVMLASPTIVIGFTSFNEQLIRALLASISPAHLFIINSIPPHLKWRAEATYLVHKDIIKEFIEDNTISSDGLLDRRASTLHYQETFYILSDIYRKFCYTNRIIMAPTGSKMQALACGLFKCCCPDVHIEYPTPESYFYDNFSSCNIRAIHTVSFNNFARQLKDICDATGLDG